MFNLLYWLTQEQSMAEIIKLCKHWGIETHYTLTPNGGKPMQLPEKMPVLIARLAQYELEKMHNESEHDG